MSTSDRLATDPLARDVNEHARAGFSGLHISSAEPEEVYRSLHLVQLENIVTKEDGKTDARVVFLLWDFSAGLRYWHRAGAAVPVEEEESGTDMVRIGDSLAPVRAPLLRTSLHGLDSFKGRPLDLLGAWPAIVQEIGRNNADGVDGPDTVGVRGAKFYLVLNNFHRPEMSNSIRAIQAIQNIVMDGRRPSSTNTTYGVITVAPVDKVNDDVSRYTSLITHSLPNHEQLRQLAIEVAGDELIKELDPAVLQASVEAAGGLTTMEAENAFALSVVRTRQLTPSVIWDAKTQIITGGGLLTVHRGNDKLSDLGGLDQLKKLAKRALKRRNPDPKKRAKGVLLLSPPGCGKSQFAKSLGDEVNRPTIILDIGALMGGIVGQTEANARRAFRTIDAMAPCIVLIDEIEKALAGADGGESSGRSDGGVSSRLLGTFLTWLNDHTSDVFVVATCNSSESLPLALTRAERFDATYFVDLPTAAQRDEIWKICLRQFDLPQDSKRPRDDQWTGAEIRACCRMAAVLECSVEHAAAFVMPITATGGESIDALRKWASGKVLDANKAGTYSHNVASNKTVPGLHAGRRKIMRKES